LINTNKPTHLALGLAEKLGQPLFHSEQKRGNFYVLDDDFELAQLRVPLIANQLDSPTPLSPALISLETGEPFNQIIPEDLGDGYELEKKAPVIISG
jgi:hypothetical protein